MTPNISSDTEYQLTEHFKNLFCTLTENQINIWNYLHSFSKKYRAVLPSHSYIAEKCECSRSTVIRALKLFNGLKWIVWESRMWRTSIYFIAEPILQIDPTKKNTFLRKKRGSYLTLPLYKLTSTNEG